MLEDNVATLLASWDTAPAVDHHCHPLRKWSRPVDALELRAAFSEALDPRMARDHAAHTAVYRDALRRIAAELGCEPVEDRIIEVRRQQDQAAYANRLLDRTRTGMLLIDFGVPGADVFTVSEHAAAVRVPQCEVVRVERVAEELVATSASAPAWLEALRERLHALVATGAVALKTIVAYRASLRLRRPEPAEVDLHLASLRARTQRGEPCRLQGDLLCHAVAFEAAAAAVDLGIPLQVHCGLGDPDEDLAEASPLGLRALLGDQRLDGLTVVLLHCYPYHREAAYLCAVHPDVFMDLSLAVPLAALDGRRAVREALGLCPWTKLLYATDAGRLPETYLVAAAQQREALAGAFGELVEAGVLDAGEALQAGREVLAGNAARLYRRAAISRVGNV